MRFGAEITRSFLKLSPDLFNFSQALSPVFYNEIRSYYQSGDHNLAYRRLIDAALDTRQPAIFRELLAYADWLDAHTGAGHTPEATRKALAVLEHIEAAGMAKVPQNVGGQLLSVEGLGKRYANSAFALRDVSFSLESGEIIGLVGENGNGKTTLLRLLAHELRPDTGTLRYPFVRDADDDYDLKTRLVYIEQRIPRWWGSLMDNLQFTLAHYGLNGEENRLWAELMLARLGLRAFRNHTWNRLSSGYRTRFELAKTLLRQPRILLLDEPLANLDIISQQTILQDLRYLARSPVAPFGMLLSSQHIYEVEKVSDRIIFLKQGTPQYTAADPAEQGAGMLATPATALIYELETEAPKEALAAAFRSLELDGIQFNGGVYILKFGASVAPSSVLRAIADAEIPLRYLRDISASSRRFFID
jgi:ABC-2 type transport system ATP-binding protein